MRTAGAENNEKVVKIMDLDTYQGLKGWTKAEKGGEFGCCIQNM